MTKQKGTRNYTLDQLRARHVHCVTWGSIARDERRAVEKGTLRPSQLKHGVAPVCELLTEDGVCAAPDIADSYILERYQGTKTL